MFFRKKPDIKQTEVSNEANGPVSQTISKIKEATEKMRFEAEYEDPTRPEDVSFDDLESEETSKTTENEPQKHIYWRIIVNLLITVAILVLIINFLPKLLTYFLPFVIAFIISTIANPLAAFFKKRLKIARKFSSALIIILVIAAIAGGLFGIGYAGFSVLSDALTVDNLGRLTKAVEDAIYRLGQTRGAKILSSILPPSIVNLFNGTGQGIVDAVQKFVTELDVHMPETSEVLKRASDVLGVLLSVIICLIASYFFTAQRDEIGSFIQKHTPKETQNYYKLIVDNFKKAIGGYFKAQFKIMLVMFMIMFIWLEIMNIPYSALVALGVSFLDFLPVFGMGAVYWPWIVIDLVLGRYKEAILISVLYAVCQLIRQLLQPKFVGDAVEMNPLFTLLCMFVGYKQDQIWGMIIAIPIGMIVLSLYRVGAFDRIIKGIKILVKGVNDFRKY